MRVFQKIIAAYNSRVAANQLFRVVEDCAIRDLKKKRLKKVFNPFLKPGRRSLGKRCIAKRFPGSRIRSRVISSCKNRPWMSFYRFFSDKKQKKSDKNKQKASQNNDKKATKSRQRAVFWPCFVSFVAFCRFLSLFDDFCQFFFDKCRLASLFVVFCRHFDNLCRFLTNLKNESENISALDFVIIPFFWPIFEHVTRYFGYRWLK